MFFFFFSSRRRHTRFDCDWSSDVCSSDLYPEIAAHVMRVTETAHWLEWQDWADPRSEEHTSELQSQSNLVCRLLLEKKKNSNYSCTIRHDIDIVLRSSGTSAMLSISRIRT